MMKTQPICAAAGFLMVGLMACASKPSDEAPTAAASDSAVAEPAAVSASPLSASSDAPQPATSGSAPDVSEPDFDAKNPDPKLALAKARRDAMEFGMIGLLNSGAAPTAPWGRDDSLAADPLTKRGNFWGNEIGDAYGAGGLGLTGIGRGGGGEGSIGLGSMGTIGHGAGTGTGQGFGSGGGRGSLRGKPPTVRMGATNVSGRLPPEVVQRIVRQNFGRFRLCYENGLRQSPSLSGKVTVSFTIKNDGSVSDVKSQTDMADSAVSACVAKAFWSLSFPQPEGGVVKVSYPMMFAPGTDAASAAAPASPANVSVEPTVAGKALVDVTALEIEKALRDAGYSDISSAIKPGTKAVVFSAKKAGTTFTLTFVGAKAGADALAADERSRLTRDAKTFTSGAFFVAVESDDKALSQALLDAIIKKP